MSLFGQKRSNRGPQKILCTFGEKAHTSKRVSIIACNNVISKVQCATHRPEGTPLIPLRAKHSVIARNEVTWQSPGREPCHKTQNYKFHFYPLSPTSAPDQHHCLSTRHYSIRTTIYQYIIIHSVVI